MSFPTLGAACKEGTERCEAGIRQALVIPLDSCYVNKGLEYRGIKALGHPKECLIRECLMLDLKVLISSVGAAIALDLGFVYWVKADTETSSG